MNGTPDPLEEKLVLAPPHPEIAPSFTEQYGLWLALAAAVLLGAALLVWWRCRISKAAPEEPAGARARRELEALGRRAEEGPVLSRISRTLKLYLGAAFDLPPGELTTPEFCHNLERNESVGPDLAGRAAEFLRRCDEWKFAPNPPAEPVRAAAQALELVELGEARRAPPPAART